MHISSLFFIVVIITVCLFGGILAMGNAQANDPTKQPDSLGNMPNAQTNSTDALIVNTTAYEDKGMGLGIVLIGIIVIVVVIFGAMLMLRNSNLGRGKYRT